MELNEIAHAVGGVHIGEVERLASMIFDEIEAQHTPEEVAIIRDILYNAGVDVSGICRKKHPPAPSAT